MKKGRQGDIEVIGHHPVDEEDVPEMGGLPAADDPLTRIADALEKMAADPEIEIEGGPPICANCGTMNPVVEIGEQAAGRGPLAEIAIEANCTHCGSLVIAIPESYSIHKSKETALIELRAKAEFHENLREV